MEFRAGQVLVIICGVKVIRVVSGKSCCRIRDSCVPGTAISPLLHLATPFNPHNRPIKYLIVTADAPGQVSKLVVALNPGNDEVSITPLTHELKGKSEASQEIK